MFTITLSSMVVWIGFYAWRVMFNNFAVEIFDATPTDVGVIQAVREIPGLLAFGVGALAVYFTESRIASLAIVVVGLGLLLSGMSPSLVMLGGATLLMSFGFHYFEPTNSAWSSLIVVKKASGLPIPQKAKTFLPLSCSSSIWLSPSVFTQTGACTALAIVRSGLIESSLFSISFN